MTSRNLADEIFAEALVAEDRAHVSMATEHVEAKRRTVHRIVGAQPIVERIRIANQLR